MKLNDRNEQFFKELATAYVNRDGESLKEDLPHVTNFSTDGLDKKLRAKMAHRKKKTIRNLSIAMSTLAAGFLMFLIFSAVIPNYLLHDDHGFHAPAEAPAAEPVADVESEPVPESEPDFGFCESFLGDEELDGFPMTEEPVADTEEDDYLLFSLNYERPELVPEAEDVPLEVEDMDSIGFVAGWFSFFEDVLPETYAVEKHLSDEELLAYHVFTPANQLVVITESSAAPIENLEPDSALQVFDIKGVMVFQRTLETEEYQLSFSHSQNNYIIVGEEIQAVMFVTETLIYSLDTIYPEDRPEFVFDFKLPRGLITIVPL